MSSVKAGDLCYVFGSPARGVNGHVVTALRLLPDVAARLGIKEPLWEITPRIQGYWIAPEKRLRPLKPPPGTVSDAEVRDLFQPQEVAYVETRKERA